MSRNIVFAGWLTKSPPTKRIWRAKWRRRWFALRQSGELPGQYFLDYFADRNCRRLKGSINLDLCEQVDAGLQMERGHGILDPKIRGSVFTIRTQSRTYHLEADSEADMQKWVEAICSVCGLRATNNTSDVKGSYPNAASDANAANKGSLYIPISECITGDRLQNAKTFTFDPKNIVTTFGRVSTHRSKELYHSQPQIRVNTTDVSDNDSNNSEDDCQSLNASQSNIEGFTATTSFTKLAISPTKNVVVHPGPRVPPRPPKTFQGPRLQEPVDVHVEHISTGPPVPRRVSHHSPKSPGRAVVMVRHVDDEEDDDVITVQPAMQYFNLSSLPPAVDRALKPRHSSIGHIHSLQAYGVHYVRDPSKGDTLQYLDLDLPTSKLQSSKEMGKKKVEFVHGKSLSATEGESAYKTVDFLKTEAFNSTRQDAEASRSTQQ